MKETLREPGPSEARYVFPYERFERLITCPHCLCNKSGSDRIPNRHTEACEDPRCECHAPEGDER